ncbi:unnamed protein product [Gongylonema pulchrum]|uniref:POP4 domain-containing protein n=1 Tax=Gongylonema pulchrum TaxID=637853 RepID=A0A183DYK5_9BILA|nr:unnamed protein product [Gongylonema pulchrum]
MLKAEIERSTLHNSWIERCGVDNTLITLIRWISHKDPTVAASILLDCNDASAVLLSTGKLRLCLYDGQKLIVPKQLKGESNQIVFQSRTPPSVEGKRIRLALKSLRKRQDVAFEAKPRNEDFLEDTRSKESDCYRN